MNFNSLLIGSEDPARLVAFYRKLLGEPTYSDESYSTWTVGTGSISIGPHSEVKGRNPSPGRLIWNIETTDVKGEAARFTGRRRDGRRRAVLVRGLPRLVDRDVRRSRRQLLPAHDADGAACG
ncbi:MAG: hypothetical protein M5T61_09270 [Acidimicrobiia bacterium]|nr:hypothetical protein [Acidimicrobiia bacterium]